MVLFYTYFISVFPARGGSTMQKIGLIALTGAALVAACAAITPYPLNLRYTPPAGRAQIQEQPKSRVVTVAAFHDERAVADPRIIGRRMTYKGLAIPFVASDAQPVVEISRAMQASLAHEGYTVRDETPQWDLNPQTVQRAWGDWVVGGAIEDISLEAKSSLFRTVYECRLKLRVVAVDVRQNKHMVRGNIELSSSYTTFAFRLQTAERMIDKLIAQAVEAALADIEKK
jgi:hypothetical protein